jgi:hypothetical protein
LRATPSLAPVSTQKGSVSIWFNLDPNAPPGQEVLLYAFDPSSNEPHNGFHNDELTIYDDGNNNVCYAANGVLCVTSVAPSTWHRFAATWNNGVTTLVLDGNAPSTLVLAPPVSSNLLHVVVVGDVDDGSFTYHGLIDEARLGTQQLDDAQLELEFDDVANDTTDQSGQTRRYEEAFHLATSQTFVVGPDGTTNTAADLAPFAGEDALVGHQVTLLVFTALERDEIADAGDVAGIALDGGDQQGDHDADTATVPDGDIHIIAQSRVGIFQKAPLHAFHVERAGGGPALAPVVYSVLVFAGVPRTPLRFNDSQDVSLPISPDNADADGTTIVAFASPAAASIDVSIAPLATASAAVATSTGTLELDVFALTDESSLGSLRPVAPSGGVWASYGVGP